MFHDCVQRGPLLLWIADATGDPMHHGTSVVHRVVEHRAGVDDPVQLGDCHADRFAVHAPQITRSSGRVQVDGVAVASISSWQHHRRTATYESEMADEAGIKHCIEVSPVGAGPFTKARQCAAWSAGQAHKSQHAAAGHNTEPNYQHPACDHNPCVPEMALVSSQ